MTGVISRLRCSQPSENELKCVINHEQFFIYFVRKPSPLRKRGEMEHSTLYLAIKFKMLPLMGLSGERTLNPSLTGTGAHDVACGLSRTPTDTDKSDVYLNRSIAPRRTQIAHGRANMRFEPL